MSFKNFTTLPPSHRLKRRQVPSGIACLSLLFILISYLPVSYAEEETPPAPSGAEAPPSEAPSTSHGNEQNSGNSQNGNAGQESSHSADGANRETPPQQPKFLKLLNQVKSLSHSSHGGGSQGEGPSSGRSGGGGSGGGFSISLPSSLSLPTLTSPSIPYGDKFLAFPSIQASEKNTNNAEAAVESPPLSKTKTEGPNPEIKKPTPENPSPATQQETTRSTKPLRPQEQPGAEAKSPFTPLDVMESSPPAGRGGSGGETMGPSNESEGKASPKEIAESLKLMREMREMGMKSGEGSGGKEGGEGGGVRGLEGEFPSIGPEPRSPSFPFKTTVTAGYKSEEVANDPSSSNDSRASSNQENGNQMDLSQNLTELLAKDKTFAPVKGVSSKTDQPLKPYISRKGLLPYLASAGSVLNVVCERLRNPIGEKTLGPKICHYLRYETP